jgi:hypothetical protein
MRAGRSKGHAFSADHDHAECTLQNRTMPQVEYIDSQELSIVNFEGTGVLNSLQ